MKFFCATRILRIIGRQSINYNHRPQLIEINNKLINKIINKILDEIKKNKKK